MIPTLGYDGALPALVGWVLLFERTIVIRRNLKTVRGNTRRTLRVISRVRFPFERTIAIPRGRRRREMRDAGIGMTIVE